MALGFFDGIHRGHIEVINDALKYKDDNTKTIIVTFTHALWKEGGIQKREITSVNLKEKILSDLGVDAVVYLEFSKVKDIEPNDFLKIIFDRFKVVHFSTGFNYHFGKKAAGGLGELKTFAAENKISATSIEPVCYEGEPLSSTRIRNAIENGEMEKANEMISRPFSVLSLVVHGRALGRTLGIPTINQLLPETQVLPKFGVYASFVKFDNKTYYGVSNIGVKPTISEHEAPICETHILNFDGDLYSKMVRVEIIDFIRPEMKFNSLDELKTQMKKDSLKANDILTYSDNNKVI